MGRVGGPWRFDVDMRRQSAKRFARASIPPPCTAIGEAAAAAYGRDVGEAAPLGPEGVARAILTIASGEAHREATLLTVTGNGLEVI